MVKAVREKRQNKRQEFDLEEARDDQQDLHDDTIEVTYSQSAARVLELIERLKYRLNSREELVEQLRRYRETTGFVPPIEALESSLDDLSVDQVATHFDSYQGYLHAAFSWEVQASAISGAVAKAYAAYRDKHGLAPSPKALALDFQYKTLPWFTTSEMARIIALLEPAQPLEASANYEQTIPAREVIETAAQGHVDHPESAPVASQENAQLALLAQYRGVVSSRADLLALSKAQLEEITGLFRSTSVFLVRLRG
ncbi:hypothetical protein D9M68_750210 [compost metagenome]